MEVGGSTPYQLTSVGCVASTNVSCIEIVLSASLSSINSSISISTGYSSSSCRKNKNREEKNVSLRYVSHCKQKYRPKMVKLVRRPRGATQMLRCTHAWKSLQNLTPKHVLSFHAKNTPKQGCFCYFIPNLTPKQVWAHDFYSALTKTTPFFLNGHFQIPKI